VDPLLRRAAAFEVREPVAVRAASEAVIEADADQIEQLLINLIRNAVEAGGPVTVAASVEAARVHISVRDSGPGLANTANVFVPFFTTKPGGTGIGLVLSRRIAEAHGGTLELRNNGDGAPGCTATLTLPLADPDVLAAPDGVEPG
jgi:signal transduction histidine kinase